MARNEAVGAPEMAGKTRYFSLRANSDITNSCSKEISKSPQGSPFPAPLHPFPNPPLKTDLLFSSHGVLDGSLEGRPARVGAGEFFFFIQQAIELSLSLPAKQQLATASSQGSMTH